MLEMTICPHKATGALTQHMLQPLYYHLETLIPAPSCKLNKAAARTTFHHEDDVAAATPWCDAAFAPFLN